MTESLEHNAITVGMLVRLRSSPCPLMTVVRHGSDMANVGQVDQALLVVGWFDDDEFGDYNEAYVRPEALVVAA